MRTYTHVAYPVYIKHSHLHLYKKSNRMYVELILNSPNLNKMRYHIFEKLFNERLVSHKSLQRIKERIAAPRNIMLELRLILYISILILTGGLATLVYENIHSISQIAIVILLAVVCLLSFVYCFVKAPPFSLKHVREPNVFFGYILLLGSLSLLTLIAYLQYQYVLFGSQFGLSVFVPMVILLFAAYRFDHLGVLSLAIVNVCAFAGLTVAPTQIIFHNDWSNPAILITATLLSVSFVLIGVLHSTRHIKPHFRNTYIHFGVHLFGLSAVSAIFNYEYKIVWVLMMCMGALYFYRLSKKVNSYLLLLSIAIYTYIGLSIWVVLFISELYLSGLTPVYFIILYLIVSAILTGKFLMQSYKKFRI